MRKGLLCSMVVLAGLTLSANAQERPAYCAGTGTERLPECGWKEGKEAATPPKKGFDVCASSEQQIRETWVQARMIAPHSDRTRVTQELLDLAEARCREEYNAKPTPLPPELQQRVR